MGSLVEEEDVEVYGENDVPKELNVQEYEGAVREFDGSSWKERFRDWVGDGEGSGRRKVFVGAVALVALVFFVVLVAAVVGGGGNKELTAEEKRYPKDRTMPTKNRVPDTAFLHTIMLGPFTVDSRPMILFSGLVPDEQLPSAAKYRTTDFAVHEVHFGIYDAQGRLLPQSKVYVHHSFLSNGGQTVGGFGAEGARSPLSLPLPYVRFTSTEIPWGFEAHLVPVWTWAAATNLTVYVNYTMWMTPVASPTTPTPTPTPGKSSKSSSTKSSSSSSSDSTESLTSPGEFKPLYGKLIGIQAPHGFEYDVPKSNSTGSSSSAIKPITCNTARVIWRSENATLIVAQGHIHIAGVNVSLYEEFESSPPKLIFAGEPLYDECGYVVRIGSSNPFYPFVKGNHYSVVACYESDETYRDVMGLVGSFFDGPAKFEYTQLQ